MDSRLVYCYSEELINCLCCGGNNTLGIKIFSQRPLNGNRNTIKMTKLNIIEIKILFRFTLEFHGPSLLTVVMRSD